MRRTITHSIWTLLVAVFTLVMTVSFASAYLKADQTPIGPGDTPDYLTSPNWSYSPPLRKFVDDLPGLTAAAANGIGQYLPVAVPDMQKYPGSDYYEIELVQYQEQMHSD
ncbi:MAG: hypothetical protein L3J63_06145, partial [Geopsychrobacter sp.]|nr:hypothetical protein [Geopsychrobacter sp.]